MDQHLSCFLAFKYKMFNLQFSYNTNPIYTNITMCTHLCVGLCIHAHVRDISPVGTQMQDRMVVIYEEIRSNTKLFRLRQ